MSKKNIFKLLNTQNSHWYFIKNEDFPDGANLPSVTNVLDCFPNSGLRFWLENTSPEEIKQKQEDGKIQGSKLHHACFLLSGGEIIDPNIGLTKEQIYKLPLETSDDKQKDDELLNYLLQPFTIRENNGIIGFNNYWDEFKPVVVAREMQVYHKALRYAGTLDAIQYLWNKKEKKYEAWLIDYKISNQHSLAYELQLVSYYKALCKMYNRNFKLRLGILYLAKSTKKKFQLKEVIDKKEAWDNFILTKKLWHATNKNAEPKEEKPKEKISVDISFKMKGRKIKLNK